MSKLKLDKVNKQLGGLRILRDISLEIASGEFVVFVGPSGCGKSTLLRLIAGLESICAGDLLIDGRRVNDLEPRERGVGMVFQSYALYPTMTVEKNMSFGLRISGAPKAEIRRRVQRAASMLQLDALLDRKPAQLSGGQRQRVAIGRALVREAGVYLFDEPLSNLDAKLRTELRRELKMLHQALGSTMIYVTHDQAEAMTLATRIVVMQGGRIQQIGTPCEVYERPANRFVAGFLGSPSMNFIEGEVDLHGCFRAGALTLALAQSGALPSAATLGARPEHLQIRDDGPLEGVVTLVEPMGNHQVVWLDCGGHALSALVHEPRPMAAGQRVRFAIDAARVSLFDPAGGRSLP